MSWKIIDIHATASKAGCTSSCTGGSWEYASAPVVGLINGTTYPFRIQNAPTRIVSTNLREEDKVGSVVEKGASGMIDAAASMPWAVRLAKCLTACEDSEEPCIAIMDAPETTEISSARVAMVEHADRIKAMKDSEKMLVLASVPDLLYPSLSYGDIIYSKKPWQQLCNANEWGMHVDLRLGPSDPLRMLDAFSLVLGSCIVDGGPSVSTALYPDGWTLPTEMFRYMTFSDNVVPGTPRASHTRGMSAETMDGAPWHATVVLQCKDDEKEDDTMGQLRRLTTSKDTAVVGAAYFTLARMKAAAMLPFVRRAMADVHTKFAVGPLTLPSLPMCRVASMPAQSSWR